MLLLTPLALATTVEFAGLTWNVRAGSGGPGPNAWSDAADAVWVDDDGGRRHRKRHRGRRLGGRRLGERRLGGD